MPRSVRLLFDLCKKESNLGKKKFTVYCSYLQVYKEKIYDLLNKSHLKRLLTDPDVIKVFHFAISDVAFIKTSLNIEVGPFCCTKVMSKLIRTYTQDHGLKDLILEIHGKKINKEQQQSNWDSENLTAKQLEYAANDVLYLIKIYRKLLDMMLKRSPLKSGIYVSELNLKAQSILPGLVELLIHGYGDKDGGWESSLFSHWNILTEFDIKAAIY